MGVIQHYGRDFPLCGLSSWKSWLFPPSLGFSAIGRLETASALWCFSFLKSPLQSRLRRVPQLTNNLLGKFQPWCKFAT